MTTRIDHTGHDHPATPAGRAACRKLIADSHALADRVKVYDMVKVDGVTYVVLNISISHSRWWPAEFQLATGGTARGWFTLADVEDHWTRED